MESNNKKKNTPKKKIVWDITWGEIDYQFQKVKEAKENKNRRIYE